MRTLKALSVAALMLGAAPAALADAASEQLVRDFLNGIDAHPDWTATSASVTSEGANTLVRDLRIIRSGAPTNIAIDILQLTDLKSREGGGFTASALNLSGASVDLDVIGYTIPTVTASGVSSPNLAALVYDPERPLAFLTSLYRELARVQVDEASAPLIEYRQRVPAPEATVEPDGTRNSKINVSGSYQNLLLSDWRDGVLASQSVGPVSLIGQQGEESFSITIDRLTGEQFNLASMAHVWDDSQYRDGRGDGEWRPFLARLRYEGLKIFGEADDTNITMRSAELSGVDIRQPEKPFVAELDALARPDVTDAEVDARMRAFLPNFMQSFRFGDLRLDGLSIVTANDPQVRFGLESVHLADVSSERFGLFALGGLDAFGQGTSVKLGRFEIAGIAFPSFTDLMRVADLQDRLEATPEADPARAEIEREQAQLGLNLIPRYDRIAVEDVEVAVDGLEPVTLDSYVVDVTSHLRSFPAASKGELKELVVPGSVLQVTPQSAQTFDALGYNRLVLNMTGDGTWDPSSGAATSNSVLDVANVGTLTMNYALSGLTESWLDRILAASAQSGTSAGDAATLAALQDLTLQSFELSFADKSIVERAIAAVAKQQNVEPGAFREQLAASVPFFTLQLPFGPELQNQAAEAVQAFLRGGQTLTIRLRPPAPLSFAAIAMEAQLAPQQLAATLGLSIEATPVAGGPAAPAASDRAPTPRNEAPATPAQ